MFELIEYRNIRIILYCEEIKAFNKNYLDIKKEHIIIS